MHLLEWPLISSAATQDEEIGGPRGAAGIGKHLEERYGKNGIAMIVDEGGSGLDERYGREFAKPAMAEKGNMVPLVDKETPVNRTDAAGLTGFHHQGRHSRRAVSRFRGEGLHPLKGELQLLDPSQTLCHWRPRQDRRPDRVSVSLSSRGLG